VLVGPVRQELLSGIRHREQFEKLRERLEAFPDAAIVTADYVQAARLDNCCRAAGVQCGEVDMLLCAVAYSNGWTILTNDTALVRCIEVVEREVTETDPRRRGQKFLEVV
jgi:predicted nucleic acid-binding protein